MGPNNTQCANCHIKCHENCYYGDGADKRQCCVMDSKGYCTKCNCEWSCHNNYRATSSKTITWVEEVESKDLVNALKGYKSDLSTSEQLINNYKTNLIGQLNEIGGYITDIN